MTKKVSVIKAVSERRNQTEQPKLRVCAYARVSTGTKAQADSYTTQVEYYTQKIEANPLWEFVGIFADEATTGTKVKGRNEFQAMIQECEDGNIDLILTKSVTRFARNTLESIQTIRRLKQLGVGIFFEKENINTLTEKSELMISILSSIAQGESEDFSGNNHWAVVKRFQDGTYVVSEPAYGYGKDEDGNLIINPDEAVVVRMIFDYYLNGLGAYQIAKKLNELQIPTKKTAEQWRDNTIKKILLNPIYEGDLLLQKTYTENTFPFTKKWNHGEAAMYLIEDDHEAIITREEGKSVRDIMKYRAEVIKADGKKCNNRYLFSSRIVCEECGRCLRRQKVYVGKPYEKIIWSCPTHIKDKNKCATKAIREDEIQSAFLAMWNKLYTNQGTVLEPLLEGLKNLPVSPKQSAEMEQLNNEIQNITEQCRILNQVMQKGYIDAAFFMENQNMLAHRLMECRKKKTQLLAKRKLRKEITKTEQLISLLKNERGLLREFKEELFDLSVKEIRISREHNITFSLHNGLNLVEENRKDERRKSYAVAYTNGI